MSLPCKESIRIYFNKLINLIIEYGIELIEMTSSGLTHTSRDHWPKGELFDKILFPETYNVTKNN